MRMSMLRTLLVAVFLFTISVFSPGQIRVSVSFGPPALPVYEQPVCPGEGFIWVPGYWAWDPDFGDYYWVPGTWVLAPEPGLLWTPGYWAWDGIAFVFYEGYWGPVVGFYGGINYGYGYNGVGYYGGRWDHGRFFYNRSVANVNLTVIHNVYNESVTNVTTVNRVSYNGGNGGITARPTPEQEAALREKHLPPVAAQIEHAQATRSMPEFRASANHGKPPVAAVARPGEFSGRGVVPARAAGAPYNPPAARGGFNRSRGVEPMESNPSRGPIIHPKDIPPVERPAPMESGNPTFDKKQQREMAKLAEKQAREQQKLQQRQEREDQRMAQQKANEARRQQLEQRHQQQTQQMMQKQAKQQQKFERKNGPS